MTANITDKITDIRNGARPNPTTVSGSRAVGGTSLSCADLTGWPTASKVHFVTYQIDSSSNPVAGTQLDCYGIVSGNTINNLTVVDGTDTGNSVNDVVEMLPTAAWGQDLADALTSQHSRTGTHTAVTATSLTTTGVVTSGGLLTASAGITASGTITLPANSVAAAALVGTDKSLMTTDSNPYKFSVYLSGNQTVTTSTDVKVQFNAENFDTNSNFDSTTNYRYVAPVNGFYWLNARVQNNGNGICIVKIYKNGSLLRQGNNLNPATNLSGGVATDLVQLSATDYIEIYVNSANATIIGASTDTYFSGILMCRT